MATVYQRLQEQAGKPRQSGNQLAERTKSRPSSLPRTSLEQKIYDKFGTVVAGDVPIQTVADTPEVMAQKQLQQETDDVEKRRKRGIGANLLTGGTGLLSSPNTARRSLMGF